MDSLEQAGAVRVRRRGGLHRRWQTANAWANANLSFGRDMHLLVFSMVVANFGSRAHERFFPLYVRDLGATVQDLGWVMSFTTVLAAVLGLVGGWASDRYSRNAILALGPSIGAIGALARAGAPTWVWLIPGIILGSIPSILVGPASFGLVSDLAPPHRRGTFYGYQGMIMGICAVVGPLAGGVVYQAWGYRAVLMGDAALLLTAAFMRYQIHDPREARRRAQGRKGPSFLVNYRRFFHLVKANPQFIPLLLASAIPNFGALLAFTFSSVYIKEQLGLNLMALGAVGAVAALAGMPANLMGGFMADRYGRKNVLLTGIAAIAAQAVLMLYTHSTWQLAAVFGGAAFVQALSGPAGQALVADIVPSDQRGTFMSVMNSVSALACIPAPALGGLLWARVGPAAPFWIGAAVLAVSILLIALFIQEPARESRA